MQLPKTYQPADHESDIYQLWERAGAFQPSEEKKAEPFAMLMPPPNANGNLHMGHALTLAVEDTVARYQRMQGKAVLYVPGADHAGFETQVVYERRLEAEGKSRFDFSRDELRQQILEFVQTNKQGMEDQVRSIGASCDWTRNTFTLDEHVVKGTYQVFKRLWDDNLIYRSQRIVNYCTYHDTSFSELEVDYEERTDKLYSLRYPLEDGEGEVVVATTRPETMLGDTAVAVHPDDSRYQNMIGKSLHLPLVERPIPIIADEAVDPGFGSGAVKVTPAHDPMDFEIGERHHLPFISIIGTNGHITDQAPLPYHDLSVEEARERVVKDLKTGGFLVDTQKYSHSIGVCYKCGTVIEPLVKDQWLVHMQPLAQAAIQALDDKKLRIYPHSKAKVLRDWYENLRDWNISRQVAWGIPIPAFVNASDPNDWIFDERTDQETLHIDGKTYHRDPDVFDTWFSSGQWPLHTLHFPEGEDFKRFYPTALMETGADILFWWVSRMLMFGLYMTEEVPFKEVYLHGLVLDEHGQKMSKSKGNVIAPQELQAEYGTDGMRVGLLSGRSAGQNQALDRSKLMAGRNFSNKLWNVSRFILGTVEKNYTPQTPETQTLPDRWMMSRLGVATRSVSQHMEAYRIAQAWEEVYELLWNDFADWYLEASKAEPNTDLLVYGLETVLRLAHPFAPFVTEAIWQQLPWRQDLLITAAWPQADKADQQALADFSELQTVITEIRSLVTELSIAKPTLYHADEALLADNAALLSQLAPISGCQAVSDGRGLPLPGTTLTCWLGVDEQTVEQYQGQLQQSLEEASRYIHSLQAKLDNRGFTHNAPKEVVEDTKQRLEDAQKRSQTLSEQLEQLGTEQG